LLILAALIFAYSQAPQTRSRTDQTASEVKKNQPVKAKKVLVKELPKDLQGIVLKDGVFRLAPGYKFERKISNTIAVALKNGSPGYIPILGCTCYVPGNERPGGACLLVVEDGDGWCIRDPWDACNGECDLYARYMGKRFALAIY
jgi:hypothetical protein